MVEFKLWIFELNSPLFISITYQLNPCEKRMTDLSDLASQAQILAWIFLLLEESLQQWHLVQRPLYCALVHQHQLLQQTKSTKC